MPGLDKGKSYSFCHNLSLLLLDFVLLPGMQRKQFEGKLDAGIKEKVITDYIWY